MSHLDTSRAGEVIDAALAHGWSLATAESLSGGLLCAALTSVPGASACVRGGVVAYGADQKVDLLDVPADLLAQVGTVHEQVALAMAHGARRRLAADVAVATTGVAGPSAHSGRDPGTVIIAIVTPQGGATRSLTIPGDRAQVRAGTVSAALDLLLTHLATP